MFRRSGSYIDVASQQRTVAETVWNGFIQYDSDSITTQLKLSTTNGNVVASVFITDPTNGSQIRPYDASGTQDGSIIALSSDAGYRITGQLAADTLVGEMVFLPFGDFNGLTAELALTLEGGVNYQSFLPTISGE